MNQIKNRYTGTVLYEYASGLTVRQALEKATSDGVNLYGANLGGANLGGANLYGVNLRGANLDGANLYGVNLRGANLDGADLYGANLGGANLDGANLRGANLGGANLYGVNLRGANLRGANLGDHGKLIGDRPFFQCGPIGSRIDYLLSFITDKGVVVKAGCFTGTMDEFSAAVKKTHADGNHAKEYGMAMLMIESHAAIWTPKSEAAITKLKELK